MKASNKKRIQLLVLFTALALNMSWVQNHNKGYEAVIASVSLITRSAETTKSCGEGETATTMERKRDMEQKFKFDRTDLKLGPSDTVSLDWDLRVFSYTCVKGDQEKVMTHFEVTSNVLPESQDSDDEDIDDEKGNKFCFDCFKEVVNLNVSFEGHIAGNNLQDLKDVIEADLDQKETALKKYVKAYKKNRKSVEWDCTKSWKDDGTGQATKIKSTEEIRACRMEVLASDKFETERERHKLFQKALLQAF